MGTYETLNDVLVNLFRDISGIEQKAVRELGYPDITMNDLHVIEAIGTGEPKSMSSVARALSVTVGTLTIAVNSLVKKGYVIRQRSSEDRRVVLIFLSARGKDVFEHHAARLPSPVCFHHRICHCNQFLQQMLHYIPVTDT